MPSTFALRDRDVRYEIPSVPARFARKEAPIKSRLLVLLLLLIGPALVRSAPDAQAEAQPGGSTTLASVASDGTQGNSASFEPAISAGGHVVAFVSSATNLVPDDKPCATETGFVNCDDVFLRDRASGETMLISIASDGTQANSHSGSPSISGDGQVVAFYSHATNLVADDTNRFCRDFEDKLHNCADIFVHDRQAARTTRVSVASDGAQANHGSVMPTISTDGRFVAFYSYATNLVDGDANNYCTDERGQVANCPDIFVHDRLTGATELVSVASDGAQANHRSFVPTISADGRYVAFVSEATNLVDGDSNGKEDVFVHDRESGATIRVSVASDGSEAQGESDYPAISADGRFVAFVSDAPNLAGGDANGTYDVFVHDTQTGMTTRISVASDGSEGDRISTHPSISAEGRFVSFSSQATNLASDNPHRCGDVVPTQPCFDVFVHDRWTGTTHLVSAASDGTPGDRRSGGSSISADGRSIAFSSDSTNLVSGDNNVYCPGRFGYTNCPDVFVREWKPAPSFPIALPLLQRPSE
ncbi:MAG TPA: hypothetical protein VER55_14925 [Ardenticatenaceae bacterium]|nr:hypothetical protein [Ardenticatenaceae bacterium]